MIVFLKIVKCKKSYRDAIYSFGVRYKFLALFNKVVKLHFIVHDTMKI